MTYPPLLWAMIEAEAKEKGLTFKEIINNRLYASYEAEKAIYQLKDTSNKEMTNDK